MRACTINVSTPALAHAATSARSDACGSWSSTPMRHLTVTGMRTACAHRADAIGDQLRLAHQAGAEAARLHAVRGTADIEIDFVIAEFFADLRRLGQTSGLGPAQLQRHGMFACVEAQQPRAVAADHRLRRHHLGIETRFVAQHAMEHPAMAVAPLHHGGNAKTVVHGGFLDEGAPAGKRPARRDRDLLAILHIAARPRHSSQTGPRRFEAVCRTA